MAVPGQASAAGPVICDVANVRVTAGVSAAGADSRQDKERRRRERRERRARRQRRQSQLLPPQLEGFTPYETGVCHPYSEHLPDLLHSHVPPPAYTTLPGRGMVPPPPPAPPAVPPSRGWRASLPPFARR